MIRRTISEIHSVDPSREIVIDGFDGGGSALPELADCGATHSGRGYAPFQITHYKAEWVKMNLGDFVPTYPGEVAPGQKWDIDSLREYYRPWREVESTGCRVHIGECGVYNKLPNETALELVPRFRRGHGREPLGLRALELQRFVRHMRARQTRHCLHRHERAEDRQGYARRDETQPECVT